MKRGLINANLLPSGWSLKSLKDITSSFKSGFSITANNIFDDSTLYPVYGGNGLRGYTTSYTHNSAYTLIGRQGALCGNLNYVEGKSYISEHAIAVKANSDNDTKFLYFNFSRLNLNKLSEASAQPGLSVEKLLKLETLIPPLAEQEKIAQALTDADNYISALEKLIEKKKQIKEGLMFNLLTGKKRLKEFAYHEDGTKKGYKDSELGKIPEDWQIQELGNLILANPDYGINAAAEPLDFSKLNYLRITDIDEDGNLIEENLSSISVPQANNYILNEGDIVLARTGASVGKSFLYKNISKKFVFAGFLIRIQHDAQKVNPSFLFLYMQSEKYKKWIKTNSMRSGQPGINSNELMTLSITLPCLEEQIHIAKNIEDIKQEINMLNNKIAKAKNLKQGMMQKLLTGEIRFA